MSTHTYSGNIVTSSSNITLSVGTSSYSTGAYWVDDSDINCEGTVSCKDLLIEDKSLNDRLTAIEERLCILSPDPELLAEYDALKQAYEHYKTLEALLYKKKDS